MESGFIQIVGMVRTKEDLRQDVIVVVFTGSKGANGCERSDLFAYIDT